MAGFESPNYTQLPNDLLDRYMPDMGYAELKVVLFLCRQTFGYHRGHARVSIRKIAKATGLSSRRVQDGAEQALTRGVVTKTTDGGVTLWGVVVETTVNAESVVAKTTPSIKEKRVKKTTPANAEGGGETAEERPTTARGRLELAFEKLSGIPRPKLTNVKRNAVRWWNPIQELLTLTSQDEHAAEELMRRAIEQMRAKKLTIAAPQSILANCTSLWAEDSQRITSAADVNFWNTHHKNSRGEVVEIK